MKQLAGRQFHIPVSVALIRAIKMVAAPEYATFLFMGRSGISYPVDVYFSDVVAGALNWDQGAGASSTSAEFWTPPENVILTDIAIVTGGTDTKKIQLTRDNQPVGAIIRHTLHLNTLANRPRLAIPFAARSRIAGLQVA